MNQKFQPISLSFLNDSCSKEQEVILEPFIKEGDATMIYSPSGVGKSFYAIGLAIAIASGEEFINYKAPKARKVFYIDGEMSKWQLRDRIQASSKNIKNKHLLDKNLILSNRELSSSPFPDLGKKEHKDLILKQIIDTKCEVVIFDNFSTLALDIEDENASSSFNTTLELIQELKVKGILPILIHHSNKTGNSYRGTTKIEAIFSNIISLEKSNNVDLSNGAGFRVKFTKNRNEFSEYTEPRTIQLIKGQGWTELTTEEDTDEKVLNELKKCIHTNQQAIANALNIAPSTISKSKKRLIAHQKITEKQWDDYLNAGEDEVENDDF